MPLMMKFKDYFCREVEIGDIIAHTNTSQGSGNEVYIVTGFTGKKVRCRHISKVWAAQYKGTGVSDVGTTLLPSINNTIILAKGHNPFAEKFVLNSDGTWKEETVES